MNDDLHDQPARPPSGTMGRTVGYGSLIWCRRRLLWEMHAAVSDFDAGGSLEDFEGRFERCRIKRRLFYCCFFWFVCDREIEVGNRVVILGYLTWRTS